MLERVIQTIRTDDLGAEDVAATRERLKTSFPPGAVRRMTQLGMCISKIIAELNPSPDDAIVYATQYAESRTLENYLDSFPAASPIGFQTSIHPGAVQQGMIRRAQPVGDFFPMAGREYLAGHSLLAAMIAPQRRVLLCGGEECGTWLAGIDGASTRAFAYGMILAQAPAGENTGLPSPQSAPSVPPSEISNPKPVIAQPAGRIALEPSDEPASALAPAAWFDLLHARKNFSGVIAPGWRVRIDWS